ncbi:MAG: hypothetical protein JW850_04585 [Thermoflexales bacterium]|nr:hypothetical protein [Thermoflexales bacterium]
MSMHWTERSCAIARIGEELRRRGWELWGYYEDKSDPMTDYWSPASWEGVATHPDYPSTVVCVSTSDYGVERRSSKDDWPVFQATPKRRAWHVERDGQIVGTGVGLEKCARYDTSWQTNVSRVVDEILGAVRSARATAVDTADVSSNGDYSVAYERNWTWVKFPAKPGPDVLERLRAAGARWGRRRMAWYIQRHLSEEEVAALVGGGIETAAADDVTETEASVHVGAQVEQPEVKIEPVLPPDWTVEDIECLLGELDKGKIILVADNSLGIPTIHGVAGMEHCGFGVFRATTAEYDVSLEAGGAMDRTPSEKGYTTVVVKRGDFPYDADQVRRTLQAYLEPTRAAVVETPDNGGIGQLVPMLPDGHPRAPLPEYLRAGLKGQHILTYHPDDKHPSYTDGCLMLAGTFYPQTGKWSWWASCMPGNSVLAINLWEGAAGSEIIGDETAEGACQALQDHLWAWGVEIEIVLERFKMRRAVSELCDKHGANLDLTNAGLVLRRDDKWHMAIVQTDPSEVTISRWMEGKPTSAAFVYATRPDGWVPVRHSGNDDTVTDPQKLFILDIGWADDMKTWFDAKIVASRAAHMADPKTSAVVETSGEQGSPDGEQVSPVGKDSSECGEKTSPAGEKAPGGKKLPAGIPAVIEVDCGPRNGWRCAQTIRVSGKSLLYVLDGKPGKVPLAGQNMVWRAA